MNHSFHKQSFAVVTGTVASKIQLDPAGTRFTLRNADGVVYVKTRLALPQLQRHTPVSVVGYLASYHHRHGGSQLFLQAALVLTAPYPRLWDDIGVPALLRTVLALEEIPAPKDDR